MKRNWISLVSLAASTLMAVGCASVPENAPKEFQDAKAELKRADDLDTDDYFPKTIDSAKVNFEQALDLYKESEKLEGDTSEMRARSAALAKRSQSQAFGANELRSNMETWDSDIDRLQGNYSFDALLGQVRQLQQELDKTRTELASARSAPPPAAPAVESPFARMGDFRISAPVAFFAPGKTDVRDADRPSIDELSNLVKPNPELMVTVSGFADSRGKEDKNEQLAMARAEAVAQVLKNNGVDPARIKVESRGARDTGEKVSSQEMALERKATITVTVNQPQQ